MHLHILGICGTFMGGIAALARAAGHRVTGSDQSVYPPMSDQLAALGIELIEGYDPQQLQLKPDVVVVGNVMSRGNALVEALLESGIAYTSGPEWLARHVLAGRWTLAVAGTHGKTTTSSILAWILEHAGLDPGFLIGGVPGNFNVTARFGGGAHFVVEADEYDTAFFDKRAKFVHYRPRTAVLNNLEHDHADIYPDVAAIQWQFHQLLRMVPRNGQVVANVGDANVMHVIDMGCWTPVERFAGTVSSDTAWYAAAEPGGDYSTFTIMQGNRRMGDVQWQMLGRHNAENALAAVLAARHAGVHVETAVAALREFRGVRRRMELRGVVGGISVYDDFAHHPTAVAETLGGLRAAQPETRIWAIFEPRSASSCRRVFQEDFANAFAAADEIVLAPVFRSTLPEPERLSIPRLVQDLKDRGKTAREAASIDEIVETVAREHRPGDLIVVMSNGGFGGIHGKLLRALS
jgi:UDP-N-acetylmuramate: L-alanyl-gamma-D-glutamyl-meso-diaminopimelate ligase